MMVLAVIDQLQAVRFGELNLLEWFGLWAASGLALYLAYRVRDLLSGRTSLTRKSKKRRTTKSDKAKARSAPRGSETVLVVDDDPGVLRAHARLISRFGYNVQRAVGGAEAVEFLKKSHVDLIVLDLLMPGMDGIETFRAIKQVNPYQRAIVLSGFAGPAMVNSIKTLGVSTYLVKPAEASMLAQAIRDEIDRN